MEYKVDISNLKILHCCMENGIRVKLDLSEALDPDRLNTASIEGLYIKKMEETGFFRFNMCGAATISGVLGEKKITIVFTYFRREETVKCLDTIFPGFLVEYENQVRR